MKAKENEEGSSLYCDICQISCVGADNMKMHLVSKKHQVRQHILIRPPLTEYSGRREVRETEWREISVCSAVGSVASAAVTSVLLTPTCKLSSDCLSVKSFFWEKNVFRSGQKHARVALKLARANTDFYAKNWFCDEAEHFPHSKFVAPDRITVNVTF